MKTRNKWRLYGGIFLFAAGAVAIFVLGFRALQTEVSVAATARGLAVSAVSGVVGVSAERVLDMKVEIGGRVMETQMDLGQEIQAGDLLLRLDDVDLLRTLERVKIDLEAEEALAEVGSLIRYDLAEARDELARKKEDAGRVSVRELELQRQKIERLTDEMRREEIGDRRRIRALQNELQRLEDELAKTEVRAPVAGHIVEVLAFPGDVLVPRAPVARVLSRDRVIEGSLSEENFAGVETGQDATVRFLSYGSRLFPAKVAKVLPAADPQTQRYTIHLDVDMHHELMVPGITGEVSIVLDERADALTIPRRALMGREVFVLREGRVEMRTIEPGFISLNRVEVLSGLGEGDRVAVENLHRLRDGDRVRIRNDVP